MSFESYFSFNPFFKHCSIEFKEWFSDMVFCLQNYNHYITYYDILCSALEFFDKGQFIFGISYFSSFYSKSYLQRMKKADLKEMLYNYLNMELMIRESEDIII